MMPQIHRFTCLLSLLAILVLAGCKSARFGIAGNGDGLQNNVANGTNNGGSSNDATPNNNGDDPGTNGDGGNNNGDGGGNDGDDNGGNNGNGNNGGNGGGDNNGNGGGNNNGGGNGNNGGGGGGSGGNGSGGNGGGKGDSGSLGGVTDTKTLTPANNKISLSKYPMVGTIEVYVDGQKMTGNWSYQISDNSVSVTPQVIPAAGKAYSVKYTKAN